MIFDRINRHLGEELDEMHAVLTAGLSSDVPLINEIAHYTLTAGGKGIRARVLLLLIRALGIRHRDAPLLAATVECIHTATLLHDDIVDDSDMRRGKPSANIAFGSAASLLVGDFLYALSFEFMIRTGNFDVLRVLAEATKRIAEGEVYQLAHGFSPDMTEENYFAVIDKKTATLFHAAARLAALLGAQNNETTDALATFGLQFGRAFQLIDDALDYGAPDAGLGKKQGDDWQAGKITLPFIIAYTHATLAEKKQLHTLYKNCSAENFSHARTYITRLGGIRATQEKAAIARDAAHAALERLPDNPSRTFLKELTDFVCARTY